MSYFDVVQPSRTRLWKIIRQSRVTKVCNCLDFLQKKKKKRKIDRSIDTRRETLLDVWLLGDDEFTIQKSMKLVTFRDVDVAPETLKCKVSTLCFGMSAVAEEHVQITTFYRGGRKSYRPRMLRRVLNPFRNYTNCSLH